jgi:hypothetical protein
MARGRPNTGPHAGKGRQHQKTRDPRSGRTYNNHYASYGRQNHLGKKK